MGPRELPQRLFSSRQYHSSGSRGLALRTCRETLLPGPQAVHTWARFHCSPRSPLRQALAREEAEAEAEGPGPTRSRRRSLRPGLAPASLRSETGERGAAQGRAKTRQGPRLEGVQRQEQSGCSWQGHTGEVMQRTWTLLSGQRVFLSRRRNRLFLP